MIRYATTDDISALVEMMDEFYAESDYELDHAATSNSFQSLIDHPYFGSIYIVNDGLVEAGYVILTVNFGMEFGGFVGHIDDLYVRPVARRKGFGRELLHALMFDCEDRKLVALSVEVAPNNHGAKSLYAQIGLQLRGDDRHTMTANLSHTEVTVMSYPSSSFSPPKAE